jgi:hypothetical protein
MLDVRGLGVQTTHGSAVGGDPAMGIRVICFGRQPGNMNM